MSKATIRIPAPLRNLTGGAGEVAVEAATVREALDALGQRHDGVLARVLDDDGEIRGFVNIYLGDTNVKALGGLETPLSHSQVISIVPAVAGGLG